MVRQLIPIDRDRKRIEDLEQQNETLVEVSFQSAYRLSLFNALYASVTTEFAWFPPFCLSRSEDISRKHFMDNMKFAYSNVYGLVFCFFHFKDLLLLLVQL